MPRRSSPIKGRRSENGSTTKKVRPDAKRVGDWVLSILKKGGWSVNGASQKLKIPNTTLSNTIKGYYLPSTKWIDRLAVMLTEIERGFDPEAAVTVEMITSKRFEGVDPEDLRKEGTARPQKPAEAMNPRSVLHHFGRLGREGRREILPEIFYILSKDFADADREQKGGAEQAPPTPEEMIASELTAAIDRLGAETIEEFAEKIFLSQGMLPLHRDFPLFLAALKAIDQGEIPTPGEGSFAAIAYLLPEIFGGQFTDDLSALMEHLYQGQAAADELATLEQ